MMPIENENSNYYIDESWIKCVILFMNFDAVFFYFFADIKHLKT